MQNGPLFQLKLAYSPIHTSYFINSQWLILHWNKRESSYEIRVNSLLYIFYRIELEEPVGRGTDNA